MNYDEFFRVATKLPQCFAYQRRLAEEPWPDILEVPTGLGKTAAVVLAWLYKRRVMKDPATPRRLIYCLPMRVLVEQTKESCETWLRNLSVALGQSDERMSVSVLMGGSNDVRKPTWAEFPECDQIIVGTQDLLLSRALMRGYGMSRYQWPMHFALLHNDALWAFDEVQLMGAGLATSAQLEAFRRSFPLARDSRSLWLSATLNREWLGTVDMRPHLASLKSLEIGDGDRAQAGARLRAVKSIAPLPVSLGKEASNKKGEDSYLRALSDAILQAHDARSQTLVIVNTVARAQRLLRLLRKRRNGRDLLIHARFRAEERVRQVHRLHEESSVDRIIVATQAIEAGVDISSKVLITELAPWASLVQRFGRCNRYGEHNEAEGACILWADIEDGADALPYGAEDLVNARRVLRTLTSASPQGLPKTSDARAISAVLRRKDLLDLFNTDPDLSGFDVDVSDYIRDSGAPGVQVFWRDFDDPNEPRMSGPERREICPISIGQSKSLRKRGAWYWDGLQDEWRKLDRDPRPGMTLLLRSADGGYDLELGFDEGARTPVSVIPIERTDTLPAFGEDSLSRQVSPIALPDHLGHVAACARNLCDVLMEKPDWTDAVVRAARWHDVGKAHKVFDETMHACERAPAGLLAKSPCSARHSRPFFRHELASMLAWLAQHNGESGADLIAYLILAHHGKVRMSLRAMPGETANSDVRRFARGVWDGDILPAFEFDGEQTEETTLELSLMELGDGEQGPSWTARALRLLGEHGPFRLSWLETLVRLADWRASAAEQACDGDGSND